MDDNTSAREVSCFEVAAQVGRTSNAALDHVFMIQGRQLMNALRHLAKLLKGLQEFSEKIIIS